MSDLPPIQPPNPGFSNYPRGPQTPSGFGTNLRPPGAYFDYIGEAWRIIQGDLSGWIVLSLCMMAITYAASIPFSVIGNYVAYGNGIGMRRDPFEFGAPFFIAFGIQSLSYVITLPIRAGFQWAALKAVRGYKVTPSDLWFGFSRFRHVCVGYIITWLFGTVATCFCLLPGLYVWSILAFTQLLILDRNMNATVAVEESARALKPHVWRLMWIFLVAGILTFVGVCICCVGMLFTSPIMPLVVALTYNNFYPPNGAVQGYAIGTEPPR